jgi:hypothetical protein
MAVHTVDRWGIQFEPIGFHSTFFMARIVGRPQQCPCTGIKIGQENAYDTVIKDWTRAKLDEVKRFMSLTQEDKTYLEKAEHVLHEIIAVDPNNAEALGFLAWRSSFNTACLPRAPTPRLC